MKVKENGIQEFNCLRLIFQSKDLYKYIQIDHPIPLWKWLQGNFWGFQAFTILGNSFRWNTIELNKKENCRIPNHTIALTALQAWHETDPSLLVHGVLWRQFWYLENLLQADKYILFFPCLFFNAEQPSILKFILTSLANSGAWELPLSFCADWQNKIRKVYQLICLPVFFLYSHIVAGSSWKTYW